MFYKNIGISFFEFFVNFDLFGKTPPGKGQDSDSNMLDIKRVDERNSTNPLSRTPLITKVLRKFH